MRSFVLSLALTALFFLLLSPSAGAATPDSACASLSPAVHTDAGVVRVDAYEHRSLGVVFGDRQSVVVPFENIEVDRPGGPDAYVIDREGRQLPARLVATERALHLALLAVDEPLDVTPWSPSSGKDDGCVHAIGGYPDSDPIATWSWFRYLVIDHEISLRDWYAKYPTGPTPFAQPGSPLADARGDLVGMFVSGSIVVPSKQIAAFVSGRRRATRARRSWIFYGGSGVDMNAGPAGGPWIGANLSVATRYRDLLELRIDGSALILPRADDSCVEGPCASGFRATIAHSIGPRVRLGGWNGTRESSIALTPDIGYVLAVQRVANEHEVRAFDLATPRTWGGLRSGARLSVGPFELGMHVTLPHGAMRASTAELGIGFML